MKGQKKSRETMSRLAEQVTSKMNCKTYITGSFRRELRGIGDLDIVAVEEAQTFTKRLLGINGTQIDIRSCKPRQLGSMLLYFTGSKWHNIHLRMLANSYTYNLTEYGLFSKSKNLIHSETESGIYLALGLSWIHPRDRSMQKFSSLHFLRCNHLCPHCGEPCILKYPHTRKHEVTPRKTFVNGHNF